MSRALGLENEGSRQERGGVWGPGPRGSWRWLWGGTRGLEDAVQTNQLESTKAPRAHRVVTRGRRRGAEVSPSRSLPSSGPQGKRPSFSAPVTRGRGAGQVGSSDTPVQEEWAGVRSGGASSLLPAAGAEPAKWGGRHVLGMLASLARDSFSVSICLGHACSIRHDSGCFCEGAFG